MGFTSSLHKFLPSLTLVLCNVETEETNTYSLYSASELPATLCVAEGAPISESTCYRLGLLSDERCDFDEIFVTVNGGDSSEFVVTEWIDATKGKPGTSVWYADLLPIGKTGQSEGRPLFELTYGFVRVQLEIAHEDKDTCFSTKDIVSLGKESFQDDYVDQMLNDLLNSSGSSQNKVIEWMLTGSAGNPQRYSVINSAVGRGDTVSLLAYLQLLEHIVSDYRRHRNYFRCHGYSKVVKTRERLPHRKVRQVGRNELLWISKNTETLYRVPNDTAIRYCGESFLPLYVETHKGRKRFDSYENQLILGFLKEVTKEAKRTSRRLKDLAQGATGSLREIDAVLKASIGGNDDYCASARLLGSYSDRERRLSNRLDGLILELEKESRVYEQIFFEIEPVFSRSPKRTKVFQEVAAYSAIYRLIEMWLRMGDYDLGREDYVMQIYRLDELYEYYVLYRLLLCLYDLGFREDDMLLDPIAHVSYSGGKGKSARNSNISNRYCLRNNGVRIRLYYEPCIWGDEKEEHGVSLHRLSTSASFSTKRKRKNSCWTPDYLLEIVDRRGRRTFHILDAKFRKTRDVYSGFPPNDNGGACEFTKCLFKYKFDIVGSDTDAFVSSVWLLCGRDNREYFRRMEQSPWALLNYHEVGSGVGVVTPYFSCLNELLSKLVSMGVAPEIGAEPFDVDSPSINKASKFEESGEQESNASKPTSLEIESYILDLYRVYHDKKALFSVAWTQKNLGTSHPLLRKEAPRGRERKGYRLVSLDGRQHYAYVGLLPHCARRLVKFIQHYRAERD